MKGTERRSPKFLLFFFFRFLRLKNYGFDNEAKFISKKFRNFKSLILSFEVYFEKL